MECEDKMNCPVYGLYVEAKKENKGKIVDSKERETPPTAMNEII